MFGEGLNPSRGTTCRTILAAGFYPAFKVRWTVSGFDSSVRYYIRGVIMWTLYTIFAIVGGPLTLFLHEFTHCIPVWVYGGKIIKFKFYPHKYNNNWRLAAVQHSTTVTGVEKAFKFQCWFYAGPLLKATGLFILLLLVGLLVHPSFFILAGFELIDAVNWWRGYFEILGSGPQFDGSKFRRFWVVYRAAKILKKKGETPSH